MVWNSVNKILPDKCKPVRVKTKQQKEYKAIFFPKMENHSIKAKNINFEFRFWNDGYLIDDVTHWQDIKE